MSHTPGPWVSQFYNDSLAEIMSETGEHVANARIDMHDNSSVIAAAPDLLRVLKTMLPHIEGYLGGSVTYEHLVREAYKVVRQAEGQV